MYLKLSTCDQITQDARVITGATASLMNEDAHLQNCIQLIQLGV